ncbi:MAG: polyprenyl synthetase family protein [Phycisphaerales bacterium]|nr:polyprenyl synthetase family protein [Phycisphaerales bacterium]
MSGMLDAAGIRSAVAGVIDEQITRVDTLFHEQLESDLPPVRDLCSHVSRYMGKMLRPTLLLLTGLATHPRTERYQHEDLLTDDHRTLAAVMEMVHMATLVHDDVLDEADTRRRSRTINRLHGNDAAVILGDYLISNAYHLCSRTGSTQHALQIAYTTNVVCEGELLQLHHRDNFSLDTATYLEIVGRKTASLIGLACRLGAQCSGADETVRDATDRFGRQLGIAFQIRDDLLDLTGEASLVGKSLGKDVQKGKLTLPVIHHLARCSPIERGKSLELLEEAEQSGEQAELVAALHATGSIEHSLEEAGRIVEQAKTELAHLTPSDARDALRELATTVVHRSY